MHTSYYGVTQSNCNAPYLKKETYGRLFVFDKYMR